MNTQQKLIASPHTLYYRLRFGRSAFAPRYAGSWLLMLLLWVCAWLPFSVSRALGAGFGLLMLATNRKRREIVRINLALCFPELSERQRARMRRRHFIKSGQASTDLGFLSWAPAWRVFKKVHFRGIEHFREHYGQRNIILLVPHLVGLNFGGSVLSRGHPLFSMIKPQSNPVVNWLLNKARMRFGSEFFLRHQGLRPVIRGLRAGRPFYYLPDEDFGPDQSVFVPFFGVPTATLTTLGRLAKSTDAVVIPCFTKLLPGGRGYEIILHPPLKHFPTGDHMEEAARMNAAMEAGIRLMPEQYLWTFKLFKTRPENGAPPYPPKLKKKRRHG
jgi:lauroyl/myristoyl acyltransferase